MKKIIILYNNAGGGHRRTAQVLNEALQQHGCSPKLVNAYESLVRDLEPMFRLFGISGENIYNEYILKREATTFFYRLFFFSTYYFFVVPNRKKITKRFADFLAQEAPDLVISVIPILNPEIAVGLREKPLPFVIIQTDLFEYDGYWRRFFPHGGWFTSDRQVYSIAGTAKGYQQALAYDVDPKKVFKLSGNLIAPHFLEDAPLDVAAERDKLGLDPNKPVGLFLYGGYAPNRLFKTAQLLNAQALDAQFIFICGKNEKLRQRLTDLPTQYPKVVLGYTTDVPYYMRLVDFLIGKSGPGVIMEAIAVRLPLLLDMRRVILHEADNAVWVEQQGFGLTFRTVSELSTRIAQLTDATQYQQFKDKLGQFNNRAIVEIPDILELIYQDFHE